MLAKPYRYILAFGSNRGDRANNCQRGIALLSEHCRFRRFSPGTRTAPLSSPHHNTAGHDEYLNFIGEAESALEPASLYRFIAGIEDAIGHDRYERWLPRHLDVDILLWAYNDHELFSHCTPRRYEDEQGLSIPHYGLWQRDFLVQALQEDFGIPRGCLLAHHQQLHLRAVSSEI